MLPIERRRALLGLTVPFGLTALATTLSVSTRGRADETAVQLYAPMTVRPALDEVLQAYRATGGSVVAVYGPTPVLVRQLGGGAPADLLLTADPDWMNRASEQGLIDASTRVDLLTTDLVLAGPPGTVPFGTLARGFDLAALLRGARVAMCDPDQHPAGRYAKQALQALDLWQVAAPHVAIAESAPAAVTFVDRGEASAAVVFRADLHGDDKAVVLGTFPPSSHAPIVYPVALTRSHRPQAEAVLAYLRSPPAQAIFTTFGYRTIAE